MDPDRVSVIPYDKAYAMDNILAVAILGIDYEYQWQTTNSYTGAVSNHHGTTLHLRLINRTRKAIKHVNLVSMSVLIDDMKHQYSPADSRFYWIASADGSFHAHGYMIAAGARMEGFILFPANTREL